MKTSIFAAALIASVTVAPASAQTVPDDTRCLLLSNIYARGAKEEEGRRTANLALMFYLGRLDGRASPTAVAAGMRAQAATVDQKASGPQMTECATRVARAQQAMQAAAEPPKPPAK